MLKIKDEFDKSVDQNGESLAATPAPLVEPPKTKELSPNENENPNIKGRQEVRFLLSKHYSFFPVYLLLFYIPHCPS